MKLARHFLVITLFCFSTMYVAASDAPASGLVQLAKVKASNGTTEDRFGSDIAASGNTAIQRARSMPAISGQRISVQSRGGRVEVIAQR